MNDASDYQKPANDGPQSVPLKQMLTPEENKLLEAWKRVMIHMNTPEAKMLAIQKVSLMADLMIIQGLIQEKTRVPPEAFQMNIPQEILDGCAAMIVGILVNTIANAKAVPTRTR